MEEECRSLSYDVQQIPLHTYATTSIGLCSLALILHEICMQAVGQSWQIVTETLGRLPEEWQTTADHSNAKCNKLLMCPTKHNLLAILCSLCTQLEVNLQAVGRTQQVLTRPTLRKSSKKVEELSISHMRCATRLFRPMREMAFSQL